VRDIALIGGAQQVEHHEIAVNGTLRRWAEIIGRMPPFSKASKRKKKKPTSF
jgi:ferritin-like metal-binding protein YciE